MRNKYHSQKNSHEWTKEEIKMAKGREKIFNFTVVTKIQINEWDITCTYQINKDFLKIITMRIFSFIFRTFLKKILFPTQSSTYSHQIFCKKIKVWFLTFKSLRHLELNFLCGIWHRNPIFSFTFSHYI